MNTLGIERLEIYLAAAGRRNRAGTDNHVHLETTEP